MLDVKTLRRITAAAFAALSLSMVTTANAVPAQAQGTCAYTTYCIWIDANFVWPYCSWGGDDGNYWDNWCGSGGGNEHLAANAATSYHNNGSPQTFDAIRSFQEEWFARDLTWYAARGARVGYPGAASNDDAESHHWYNG
jgi:hypothetical protein